MAAKPKISVSVVLYRDYETPSEMLRSLYAHTDPALAIKVFAVDNSDLSTGDSLLYQRDRFVSEFAESAGFEYVDAYGNLGFGKANNLALERAASDFHAFVNPDVIFTEDALSELASFMGEHPEAGMAIPRMVGEDGNLQPVYRRGITVLDAANRMLLGNRLKGRDRWHTMADEDYSRPFCVPFGQGSFLFGRTELLKDLDGFDDRFFMYLEDADLCRRVNEVSELLYCPDATIIHKWERSSRKSARMFLIHLKSYIEFFNKWGIQLR